MKATLYKDRNTFLIISCPFLLERRNVVKTVGRENQNIYFVFNNVFFENCAVYWIMWKNTVERGRPQMAVWRMRITCWTPKATNTLSQYVIFIATPL